MATQLRYLSGTGGFLPQATGQVIQYIRNPKEFTINEYAQYIEAPAPVFTYPYVDPDQPVRIVNEAEFAWEDGAPRPSGNANLLSYQWIPGRCFRRSYPWTLGDQAIETTKKFSKMDPAAQQAGVVAAQAMTNRTNRVVSLMQTAGNWSSNTSNSTALGAGSNAWSNASDDPTQTSNYLTIRKALLGAAKIINLATNGMVRIRDLRLVVSPGLAIMMADTAEIYNYIKNSPYSFPAQKGEDRNMSEDWGLPPKLYGFEVHVEDSPIVNLYANSAGTVANIGASGRHYCMADTSAVILTRIGGVKGSYGAPSFSTLQIYFYKNQMSVFTFNDTFNQREQGFVDEQFLEVLAAPASGYLITGIS